MQLHRRCASSASSSSLGKSIQVGKHHQQVRRTVVRSGGDGPNMINEDVLARLKAAEEEAAKLRKQLEVAQAAKGAPTAEVIAAKPKRIDSTDDRETLFTSKPTRSSWLSEADVEFFVGSGVGETSSSAAPKDAETEAVVQRRLLIGGALTAGALAFALVPTESLRPKPSKPLYVYVVPLLRIQDLLAESASIIEDANWDQLRVVLSRIQGPPNNVRENLSNVVALLEDASTRSKAVQIAADVNEYLDDMDYNKYFDQGWTTNKTISGAQNAEFVKFSNKARLAAQQNLSKFLQLVPQEAVQLAFNANRIPDQ